jgi:hypothetical protein
MQRRRVLIKRAISANGQSFASAVSTVVFLEEGAIAHQSVEVKVDPTGAVSAASSSISCSTH